MPGEIWESETTEYVTVVYGRLWGGGKYNYEYTSSSQPISLEAAKKLAVDFETVETCHVAKVTRKTTGQIIMGGK